MGLLWEVIVRSACISLVEVLLTMEGMELVAQNQAQVLYVGVTKHRRYKNAASMEVK